MSNAKPLWLRLAPLIFLVLWSAGFSVGKAGLSQADPLTFLALRYACVVVLMLPLMLVMRPPLPASAAAWGHLTVVGLLIQAMYFSMTYLAMHFGVSAGGVALIVSLQPIVVALLAPRMVGERIGVAGWIGLALGLAGAALVIVSHSAVGVASPVGLLCAALALVSMTGGTLYEKRFGTAQHPVTANFIQYVVGLLVTLPLAWLFEPMHIGWSPKLYAALAYLVVCNSIVAISLLLAMIRHGEASRVSALFFLVPPAAALIAWLMLGEQMPPLAWLGMAVAAVGVAVVTRRR